MKMENEKRLIDANTLKAKAFADPDSGEAMVYLQDIDEARTVDAVEVVRCKDCHWWRLVNKRNGCGICSHEVFSIDDCTVDPVTEPNDFCSYGERRSDYGEA